MVMVIRKYIQPGTAYKSSMINYDRKNKLFNVVDRNGKVVSYLANGTNKSVINRNYGLSKVINYYER